MPRRPLSAYNIFFREKRGRMLAAIEAGKSSAEGASLFSTMGKSIAKKWKALTPEQMVQYTDAAGEDLKRYRKELDQHQKVVFFRGMAKGGYSTAISHLITFPLTFCLPPRNLQGERRETVPGRRTRRCDPDR